MKRKTREEYVNEIAIKNPNVEIVGQYVNTNTLTMHHCLTHDFYWETTPARVLHGVGCEMCRKEKFRQVRCKTHMQYIKEVKEVNPNIEVVGQYVDAKTKIKHYCKTHDIFWNAFPENILKGNGCVECGKKKICDKSRKTHKQYIKEVMDINPDIEVLGNYIGANTPILHRCLIDGYEWNARPANILFGKRCPKCVNCIKRTHEKYIEDVLKVNKNIEVLEEYINANTPILHRCKTHNIEWNAYPSWILKGSGCIECGKEKIGDKNKKSHEQYVNELKEVNPNIIVIGNYINANVPILHKCLSDGYEWYAQPNNILFGTGCPKCANNIKITNKEYVQKVLLVNNNIDVIEQYIDAKTPILHRCKFHNIEWKAFPESILRGCGCMECKKEKIGEKNRKTHEQYINEVKGVNHNIEVLGKYINSTTPILHKCLLDGYEWETIPSIILQGCGCPQCNESKGEKQIRKWLDKHNITYETQKKFVDCCDIRPLPFDFYLTKHNIVIEYDGKQHNEPVEHFGGQEAYERTVKHDNIKNEYCKNNGISLLRIPYYKNIEEELNNFLFI